VSSPSEALENFSAVVVTGGSSGIGKSFIALCRKLKPELAICNLSRRVPPENITPRPGKKLNHFPCDLAVPGEVARVAGEVGGWLEREVSAGRVLLINNSGIGSFGRFPKPNLTQELRMIDLNVRSVVELTGRLLPMLQARGGAVLNVASVVGFQPTALSATYGATKAFVLNWSVALHEELRDSGVQVLAVCPGTTRTEFFRASGVGAGVAETWAMSSEAVVEASLRALGQGRAVVVPGWRNRVMTFFGARVGKALAAKLSARVLRGRMDADPPAGNAGPGRGGT
jgi:hypothetical protein